MLSRLILDFMERRASRRTVRRINEVLRSNLNIQIEKVRDVTGLGLHWYVFKYFDLTLSQKIRGSGFGFTDEEAVVRAWGEFVERYSFSSEIRRTPSIQTSSGFAAHTTSKAAEKSGLAELVERDVFLSHWLLRKPAEKVEPSVQGLNDVYKTKLKLINEQGYATTFGLYGQCLGFHVGVVVLQGDGVSVMATAAKTDRTSLLEHLIREAATAVSDLSSDTFEPINELLENAAPIDHLRYYLKWPQQEFLSSLISENARAATFPGFSWDSRNLTTDNALAIRSGYQTTQIVSNDCQHLWFGPTKPHLINLNRLQAILGKEIAYEELNLAPHPLA